MKSSTTSTSTTHGNGKAADPIIPRGLFPNHAADLARSGITPEIAKANGIYSEANRSTLASLLRFVKGTTNAAWGPALVFPYSTVDGREAYHRLKFDNPPKDSKGKPQKYKAPRACLTKSTSPPAPGRRSRPAPR